MSKILKAKIAELETENKRINDLAQKRVDDLIAEADEQTKLMSEAFQGEMKKYGDRIKEMENKKDLLTLTVNITGVQDIGKALDDAVTLLKARLETLGLKDKYLILAIPSTMHIDIKR